MMYDTIIVGSGPAGLSAAIYAARGSLKVIILEKNGIGGQIATATKVDNYPGTPAQTTGKSLSKRMHEQCIELEVEFSKKNYFSYKETDQGFLVQTNEGTLEAKTIIIATGKASKSTGYKGEQEFRGLGVSYCVVCDANFFKGLNVAVIGGDDTALTEALYLTKFAKEIIIIHSLDKLLGEEVLRNKIMNSPIIKVMDNTDLVEIKGNDMVESIYVKNRITEVISKIPMDGVFIFVGQNPDTEVFVGSLQRNVKGFLVTDE